MTQQLLWSYSNCHLQMINNSGAKCKNERFLYANINHKVTYMCERAEWLAPLL